MTSFSWHYQQHNIPPLLSSERVADILSVRIQQVQRWARSGRLKSYRAGRLLRFLESDIRAFVGLQESGTPSAHAAPLGMVSGNASTPQAASSSPEFDADEPHKELSPKDARQAGRDLQRALRELKSKR